MIVILRKCFAVKFKVCQSNVPNYLCKLIGICKHVPSPCRVLLAVGQLYSETGNPTNATTYVLDCITRCKKHHLQYLEALAMTQLAYIQVTSAIKYKCGLFDYSGHGRIQSGDKGFGVPLKNHKNIWFLSNTGPDPLKITKLPCQHLMLGR